MKRVIAVAAAAMLAFTSFSTVFADELSDSQEQLEQINAQKAQIQKEIKENKNVKQSLNKEIKDLNGQIALQTNEIQALDVSIGMTQERINEALDNLDALEAEIAEQNRSLNARLRAMYKNGDSGFLDVLLGSASISDLMTNMDRVQRIYDQDKEMLKQLETQHELVEAQRQYLRGLQTDLESNQSAVKDKKASLEENKTAVAAKQAEVESNIEALEELEDALNAEANALVAEILKLQGNGEFVGGAFTWPAPGTSRITSPFGNRLHPILKVNKLHTGIDIGCGSNTTIVAANSGTVIKAAWNNSYGNMIMVDHGGGIVTLYAHLNSFLVSNGDVVAKGQAIANSGSTGMSTGPHLHFEVRVNGNYVDPTQYVTYGK
ncbi:MAG: peptidoglycan DD-metalloendopeptidase family protein [Firmicutes bacterium]|nr:peptidoglycan DD-metalloendopeptidase family protein [Bacillota bacterium]